MEGLLTPALLEDDHVRGSREAPLELVMFGDFQCPFCLAAQSSLRRVRERLGDRLLFAFRHLPIPERHPLAQAAAEASEAAAAQDRFWDYHDELYRSQPRLSEAELTAIAERIGLELERFEADRSGGRFSERVARDVRSAMDSGAQGTPTFFANGRLHAGAYDAGSLVEALNAAASRG